MPRIKTTITIDEELFLQVKELAVLLRVSRSRIFEMAMEEFLRRHAEATTLDNTDYDNSVQAAKELNEKHTA